MEKVMKTPATPDDLRMLEELSKADLETTFERDFVTKNKQYAGKWGLSDKQRAVLHEMYAKKITGIENQDTGTGDDDNLVREHISAEQTPTGYLINTPVGKLGPTVSRREAVSIVAWLEGAWLDLEAGISQPVEETNPNNTEPPPPDPNIEPF